MTASYLGAYGYVVDGASRQPNTDVSVADPATNEEIATVPEAGQRGVDDAVASSRAVRTEWAGYDTVERGRVLRAIAEQLRRNVDRLAELETLEMGRPLSESVEMVRGAARYFEYYAGLTDKVEGRQIPLPGDGDHLDYTVREPYGVTAQIVPWNASIALAARGFAPALATGNTVVAKAPSTAPLSLLELTDLATIAGLPDGVLNTVTGSGSVTGDALVTDDRIDAIEFTGSTDTGKRVLEAAASRVIPTHLELGGKGANIVFADADLEGALESVVATFRNAGQICYAPTRVFVETDIYDTFVERAAARVESLEVGPGMTDPDVGPLVSPDARETVAAAVAEASDRGGRTITGGEVPRQEGNFFAPTLLDGLTDDDPLVREEVFGPVVTLHEFESRTGVVERANDTRYGLLNLVWTDDLARAHSVAGGLESGTVLVNDYPVLSPAAVSGGFKESGLGRSKGRQAIEAFTQTKNVVVSVADADSDPCR